MSLDADWRLPGSVNEASSSSFSRGAGAAEVGAIVDGGLNRLREWMEERLHYQDKLLYHLINARAPLSTAKRKDMRRRKQSFAQAAPTSLAGLPALLLNEQRCQVTGVTQEPQSPCSGASIWTSQKSVKDAAADRLEESSKTSSQQSSCELEDVQGPTDIEASPLAEAVIEDVPDVESPRSIPGYIHERPEDEHYMQSGLDLNSWRQRMVDLFDELDLDGSGTIDRSELRTAFIEVGIPPIEALQTFMIADKSNSDDIDRVEWLHIIESASIGRDAGSFVTFARKLIEAKDAGSYDLKARRSRSCCIIRHDAFPRMWWDFIMMLFLAYVSVSLPFSFGFGSSKTLDKIDHICDGFFLVDILLNFRTSYIDSEECLVLYGKRIAIHYLRTWFTLDFVSSVPWDLITSGLLPGMQPAKLMKIGKIAKVLKLLRLGKVLKLMAGSTLLERVEEHLPPKAHQTGRKISSLVIVTMMLCHWLACFMVTTDGSCIDRYLGDEASVGRRYLAALYWAMTTLTTVGYGDVLPTSDNERLYAMLAMIIGGSFYGYIIGSMTSVITDMDIDARAFNERMEMLDAWLEFHEKIPTLLKRRIRRHFRRQLRERSSVDDGLIVKDLSPELRADTASFVIHVEVRRNPVFRELPNAALGSLLDVLKITSARRGESIITQGDPGIAMYIIVEGMARFTCGHAWIPPVDAGPGKGDTGSQACARLKNVKKLIEGDSFGEEIIFTLEETYRYTIVAESHVGMFSLSEDAFKIRFRHLPDLYDTMLQNFMDSRK